MNRFVSTFLGLACGLLAALPALAQYEDIKDPAEGWEHLWSEVLIDITVIGVIFGVAAIYLLSKYRAKSPDEVGSGFKMSKAQMAAWALIPATVFMADDFYLAAKGWSLWNIQRQVPEGAMEIRVTGQQWFFEFEYENGVVAEELRVPVGQPVVLRMTSKDVIHSFGLPDYQIKEDLMPGRITYLWFYPKEQRETVVTCVEFCGLDHAGMYTKVSALPRAEFDAWMARAEAEAKAEKKS